MKNIYDNREAILKEPLSSNAFVNKGLRLRTKLSRQQKLFGDRLAEVTLNFSKRMNIDIGLVTQIAEVSSPNRSTTVKKVNFYRNYGRESSPMFLDLKI